MINRNLLDPPPTPEAAYDLEKWDPQALHPEDYAVFQPLLDDLETVTVMHVPGERGLYAVAEDRISYAVATPQTQTSREHALRLSFSKPSPPKLAFGDGWLVDGARIAPEALARGLHLMLGRACLRQAVLSDNSQQFAAASSDLVRVFSVTKNPAYSLNHLNSSLTSSGLLTLYKRAAMHYKTTSRNYAEGLVSGIARAIPRGGKWYAGNGLILARSIGYPPGTQNTVLSPEPDRRRVPKLLQLKAFMEELHIGENDTIVYQEQAEKKYASDFRRFVGHFPEAASFTGTSEQLLDTLHKKYAHCRTSRMPMPDAGQRDKVTTAAFRAYFVAQGDRNTTAKNLLKITTEHGHRDTEPIILAGNLAFLKLQKARGEITTVKTPVLGFDEAVLPAVFKTFQEAIHKDKNAPPETPVAVKLGELVTNYFNAVYGMKK
jgi:hypothetical protein